MARILFVVGDPATLTTGDTARRNHLTTAGNTVTLRDDATAAPGDYSPYDLVILSGSCSGASVAAKYKPAALPVIVEMPVSSVGGVWGTAGMCLVTGTSGPGTIAGTATTWRTNQADPLVASNGIPDPATVFTSAQVRHSANAGTVPGAAHVLAYSDDGTRVTCHYFDAGAALSDATAAAGKRAGVCYVDTDAAVWAARGYDLYFALIAWMTYVPPVLAGSLIIDRSG